MATMFLGHFALAFAAKKAAPTASLGTLVLASQWADAVWPALILTGVEKVRIDPGNTPVTPLDFESYPYSHSLVALLGWGLALGAVYFAFRRKFAPAIVLGGLVVSHWVLDWISHRPDMPIALTGANRVGLGLWYSRPGTVVVEGLLFAAGLYVYWRSTRPQNRKGTWGLAALAAVLLLIYGANLTSPPPPSVEAIGYAGLAGAAVFCLWAAWVDRHREIATAI